MEKKNKHSHYSSNFRNSVLRNILRKKDTKYLLLHRSLVKNEKNVRFCRIVLISGLHFKV